MVVSDEETELVHLLIFSIPRVFKSSGTPDDLNFILTHMKQAILHRGVSESTQRLLINLLVPLGSFKSGYLDARELQRRMLALAGLQQQRFSGSSVMMVSKMVDLKAVAVELAEYSKTKNVEQTKNQERLKANRDAKGRRHARLVYSRDSLLKVKNSRASCHHLTLPKAVYLCKCKKKSAVPWLSTLRQIARCLEDKPPTKTFSEKVERDADKSSPEVVQKNKNLDGVVKDETVTSKEHGRSQTAAVERSEDKGATRSPTPASGLVTPPSLEITFETLSLASTKGTAPDSAGGTPPTSIKGTSPDSARGTPPNSARGTPPTSIKGTSSDLARGTPPTSIKGTPPDSARGTPPTSIKGTPPDSAKGTPPTSIKKETLASSKTPPSPVRSWRSSLSNRPGSPILAAGSIKSPPTNIKAPPTSTEAPPTDIETPPTQPSTGGKSLPTPVRVKTPPLIPSIILPKFIRNTLSTSNTNTSSPTNTTTPAVGKSKSEIQPSTQNTPPSPIRFHSSSSPSLPSRGGKTSPAFKFGSSQPSLTDQSSKVQPSTEKTPPSPARIHSTSTPSLPSRGGKTSLAFKFSSSQPSMTDKSSEVQPSTQKTPSSSFKFHSTSSPCLSSPRDSKTDSSLQLEKAQPSAPAKSEVKPSPRKTPPSPLKFHSTSDDSKIGSSFQLANQHGEPIWVHRSPRKTSPSPFKFRSTASPSHDSKIGSSFQFSSAQSTTPESPRRTLSNPFEFRSTASPSHDSKIRPSFRFGRAQSLPPAESPEVQPLPRKTLPSPNKPHSKTPPSPIKCLRTAVSPPLINRAASHGKINAPVQFGSTLPSKPVISSASKPTSLPLPPPCVQQPPPLLTGGGKAPLLSSNWSVSTSESFGPPQRSQSLPVRRRYNSYGSPPSSGSSGHFSVTPPPPPLLPGPLTPGGTGPPLFPTITRSYFGEAAVYPLAATPPPVGGFGGTLPPPRFPLPLPPPPLFTPPHHAMNRPPSFVGGLNYREAHF